LRVRVLGIGMLVLLGIGFLVTSWSRIDAPFADSDEGINGAVWGAATRSLREQGIVASRFGGVRLDGSKYATHPPLLVAETAVIEAVAGEHPWSTRAAAWLGALATIPLLYALIRSLALDEVTAAAATVGALACHMFLTYGSMLDTMVVAFPFALAAALAWHRRWLDDRPFPLWLTALLASLAGLAGWQGIFLVGLCGAALLARFRSRGRSAALEALPFVIGGIVSLALTLGWARWTHGSLDVLQDKLTRRSGANTSIGDMVSFQLPWLGQLLGVGLLAAIVCVASLRSKRFRPLAGLALASVVLYALALREGSGGHQYWNYWALLPAAIGLAYVLDLRARRFGAVAVVVLVGVLAVANLVQRDQAGELIAEGQRPYDLVAATTLAPGQSDVPYLAEPYRPDDWLRYRGAPLGRPLLHPDDLRTLARDHPDFLVLLLGTCASPDPTGLCQQLTFPAGSPADTVAPRMESAGALAARLAP
jgi:hypothetical protein